MPKASSLRELVSYCDSLLRLGELSDYAAAANGLQVQNPGRVTRIAAAVDATLATARMAVAAKADFLLVHHGLFWSPSHPWTGKRYELLRVLLDGGLAVYSAHLPLDSHPKFGNNAQLCAALKLTGLKRFFYSHEHYLGFKARTNVRREALARRLQVITGAPPRLIPGGGEVCHCVGVVSGGAGSDLAKAAGEGVDTYITGEGPHWTYGMAEELGLNVFYAGHYATETFGVKALAAHLSRKFRLPWVFLDHPTGL